MGSSVIPLSDVSSIASVGGKAAALGELLHASIEVPAGFVVPTNVVDLYAVQEEILQKFDELGSEFTAVRSSAVAEDGAGAAWAGQLETYLNVTRDGLLKAVENCQKSAQSKRARAYASQKSLVQTPVAVIVQAMIQSEVSGVAFSLNPVTNDQKQIIIEAGLGLGEAVVSGEITPDMYIIDKLSHTILEKNVVEQHKKLIRGGNGKNEWQAIGAEGHTQKLTDTHISAVARVVKKLEHHFAFPVDVEWAFADNQLYILQCRPITTT